jgi:hypothetical protein
MTIKITLKEYLQQIKNEEKKKPIQHRRVVPRIVDFAEVAGVSRTGFIKFMNNSNKGFSREMVGSTMMLLRSRGFPVEVQDLIVYTAPEDHTKGSA